MGSIDNGTPKRHCGNQELHVKHLNVHASLVDGTYCDGVPELGEFVELTVRVPLVAYLNMNDCASHQEALDTILDEGISTYIFDEVHSENSSVVLRLRVKGEDRVYPLRGTDNGMGMEVAHDPRHEPGGSEGVAPAAV